MAVRPGTLPRRGRRIPSRTAWNAVAWDDAPSRPVPGTGKAPAVAAALLAAGIIAASFARPDVAAEPEETLEPVWIVDAGLPQEPAGAAASATPVEPVRETPAPTPVQPLETPIDPEPVAETPVPAESSDLLVATAPAPSLSAEPAGPSEASSGGMAVGTTSGGGGAPEILASALARVRSVVPRYPRRALALGVESRVVALVVTDTAGAVVDVRIERSGGREFDESVREALRETRFVPPRREGRARAAAFRLPYDFRLE